jgi:thiol-disulfide isomerase/thioredoxin
MTDTEATPQPKSSSKRLWLVGVILVGLTAAAYVSQQRRDRLSLSTETVTLGDGRPKLIEFGMGACVQCKKMKPVMEQAERELGKQVEVRILDIRYEPNELLADKFDLRTMPLIVLTDGAGKALWRHEGFVAYATLARAVRDRLQHRKAQ